MASVADTAIDPAYPIRIVEKELDSGVIVPFARFDPEGTGPEVEKLFHDFDGNEAAMAAARRRGHEVAEARELCVYVVGMAGEKASKIGVSKNPASRLDGLQYGSPKRLYFSHLFWMDRADAWRVEALMLSVIEFRGRRAIGEWTSYDTGLLASTLTSCLIVTETPFSNSAMFCQNLRNVRSAGVEAELTLRGGRRNKAEENLLDALDQRG